MVVVNNTQFVGSMYAAVAVVVVGLVLIVAVVAIVVVRRKQ